MATLEELGGRALPDALKALQDSSRTLAKLAVDVKDMNDKAVDKKKALEDTKQYAFQALASVAYQVNVLAQSINQLMELQVGELEGHLADVRAMSQQIAASHEFVGRKAIGDINVVPSTAFRSRAVKLNEPQFAIADHSQQGIDLYALDHVGLGRTDGRPAQVANPIGAAPVSRQPLPTTPMPMDPMDDMRGRTNTGSSVLAFKNRLASKGSTASVGPGASYSVPTIDSMPSNFYADSRPPPPPPPPAGADQQAQDEDLPSVQVMYDYAAQTDEEISIAAGDILLVTNPDVGDGWMEGKTLTGQKGIFPQSYVEFM